MNIRRLQSLTVIALLPAIAVRADEPRSGYEPRQIIDRAIAYHDPNGVWQSGRISLGVHTTYSEELSKTRGISEAALVIVLAPGHDEFSYTKEAGGDRVEISVRNGGESILVNGSAEVSEEELARLRLAEPGVYRDYCEYLYGMPMKLKDAGTILDPRVNIQSFNDRIAWELRVTYEPEVGGDVWYFYFDRDTFALIGYKFYHDESKNDGEYITLEGEIVDAASGLRLPRTRAWYYNEGDGHLATDDIVSMSTR